LRGDPLAKRGERLGQYGWRTEVLHEEVISHGSN
jgi:hypothetical protein